MTKLDNTDRELISLLRSNARLPVSSLAPRLGVSRATVRSRIDRLVESGVIQGFTLAVGQVPGAQIRAITTIKVEGQLVDKVYSQLAGYSEIHAIYSTNGRWDIVTEIETANLEAFDELLRDVRKLPGVVDSETNILLACRKTVRQASITSMLSVTAAEA